MRRALPFAFVILPALAAAALVGPSAATPTGRIGFSGRVIDGNDPLAPGSIVTLRGDVVARSGACIEAHLDFPAHPPNASVWLCSRGSQPATGLPDVGDSVAARARISGVRTTPEGPVPFSDSFVLLHAD